MPQQRQTFELVDCGHFNIEEFLTWTALVAQLWSRTGRRFTPWLCAAEAPLGVGCRTEPEEPAELGRRA